MYACRPIYAYACVYVFIYICICKQTVLFIRYNQKTSITKNQVEILHNFEINLLY